MIQVLNLTKYYGKRCVLNNITIDFASGHIYGLVGPNGCGKTTLMRCICGFTHSSSGSVRIDGKIIGTDCDFAPNTGIIIESPGFLPQHSARQNLRVMAGISGIVRTCDIDSLIRRVGLDPEDKRPVQKYSLGMRQRLGIAQALMENPTNLILDEPFNGLDKQAQNDMHVLLQEQKNRGVTVILASHSLADISRACDVVYELQAGRVKEK